MLGGMNSSTAINPSSNSIGAYMVVSVGELRELLRVAEDAAAIMRPDGNNYTASTVVLRLDVYTSDELRSSRGEYQAQVAETTRRQMLSQQFCDPTLSEPRRWTKPSPAACAAP